MKIALALVLFLFVGTIPQLRAAQTPSQILASASAFQALSDQQIAQCQSYLLMIMAGVSATPTVILSNAAAFQALDDRSLQICQTYLLSTITSSGGGATNAPPVDPTRVYVRSNGNDETGARGTGNAFKTVAAAIAGSQSGDTIDIGAGTFTDGLVKTNRTYLLDADTLILPVAPGYAIACTNGSMTILGLGTIEGEVWLTNATVSVECGGFAPNVSLTGMSSVGQANYLWVKADTVYMFVDTTTNLTLSVSADTILNVGQFYPGASINAQFQCRRLGNSSVVPNMMDANSDANTFVSFRCGIVDVDFGGAFQFAATASKRYNISAGMYKFSSIPNTGAAMTLDGGIVTTALNSGQATNTLGTFTVNTAAQIPSEPRNKYYALFGL